MLERPPLSDETIARCLHSQYGVSVGPIDFLPIGYDSTASVFRVTGDDGTAYFLKAKTVPPAPASLAIPSFLSSTGVAQVVAPLTTATGTLSAPMGDGYTAILYPFVEGRMGANGGLSPTQWTEFGQIVRRVHAAQLPPALAGQMRREPFAPLKGDLAWALHREIATASYADPIHQELADFWRGRGAEIERILRRAEELGRMAAARQPEIVLCHADIHLWNVLVAPDERIFVIDWDETILAPKERDLMFLVDGTQPDGEALHPNEAAFRQGYGPTEVDPVILAFYRFEWAVQEIAEFGKQVLWSEEGGEITRLDGLRHFRALFDPGGEVAEVYRSDV
jgi:spectinomycin phosphotransferase